MKILSVIVGLALTAGGVYLAYDTFIVFDELETLRLGVLLGGSFLAMTVGLYLFLLPLAMKPKAKKNKNSIKEVIVEQNSTEESIREIEALHIAQEDGTQASSNEMDPGSFESLHEAVKHEPMDNTSTDAYDTKAFVVINEPVNLQPSPADIDQTRILSTSKEVDPQDVVDVKTSTPAFSETSVNESNQTDDRLFTTKLFNDTLDVETKYDLRVIGIESFGSQRILKKLQPDSELKLSYKQKKGLNLAQVTYREKLIGYVSRLEMNHLNKSLDQLIRVTPGDIVIDGRKVIRFSVHLHFKDETQQDA